MPNDRDEVYYAEAAVPFPQSELERLPVRDRHMMYQVTVAQDNYCKSQLAGQLAEQYANGNMPNFTTGALSESQCNEIAVKRTEITIRPNDVEPMSKTMVVRFHLKKTPTTPPVFEAVAFESIASLTVVKLNPPFVTTLTQERIAAAETKADEMHKLRAEIRQLKMAVRQLEGHEPATIAAPRRPK